MILLNFQRVLIIILFYCANIDLFPSIYGFWSQKEFSSKNIAGDQQSIVDHLNSFDINSLDINSLDINSLDINSLDINSLFISWYYPFPYIHYHLLSFDPLSISIFYPLSPPLRSTSIYIIIIINQDLSFLRTYIWMNI